MQYVSPQPDDAELSAIYGAEYFAGFGASDNGDTVYREMQRQRADSFLRTIEKSFAKGRLLDVGCGLGEFLSVATGRGWNPTGVDRNASAAECAEERIRRCIHICEIEEFAAKEESFDFVVCLDVIEHLRRPDAVLAKLYPLVRPGGGILLTTIDVGSMTARLMGRRWPHYHRDHLWYFTRESLSRVVSGAGFRALKCSRARKQFTLEYLLAILSRADQDSLLKSISRWSLRRLPAWLRSRCFRMSEGSLLIARRESSGQSERGGPP